MEEHNELTVTLDKVREITLFMSFDEIFLFLVSAFGMVHLVRPKSVFAIGNAIDSGMGLLITIDKLRVFINKTLSI
jgi:hypothetical protein